MPGIAHNTVAAFQHRVNTLNADYIAHWNAWIATQAAARPAFFGSTLRKWQACRPNRMRRVAAEAHHPEPYLENLIADSADHVTALNTFDIANVHALDNLIHIAALQQLWGILEQLSYHGKSRGGLAGGVGISKAVMLLTDGRVGPAFDREVRNHIGLRKIETSAQWLAALRVVSIDIQAFEHTQNTVFSAAKPAEFAHLNNGRVYDMALGPR